MPREPDDGDEEALSPTTPNTRSDESGEPVVPPFRPSDKIGKRYQLEGLLGRGGMGTVYRARDEALGGKPVALKLIAGDVSNDPAELKRLRDEVLLAQKVTHPAVCRTYDLEEIDGLWLIKMEVVDGESLAHRLRAGRMSIDDVRRIAREIMRGLGAAHRQGVIHRDLKPQNVMIERDTGRIVLMDFGVAREASTRISRSSMVDIVGTPDYMAPEQAKGDPVDARTDLYALGCVIYEMLTGVVPYPARGQPLERPPDPRIVRPETPRWLANVVRRLLEKDPARRPRDAAAVIALAMYRPYRRWLIAGAIAVGVVAIGAGVSFVRARTRPPWRPVLVEVLPRVDENLAELSISPDGTQLAFDSDRDQRNGAFRIFVGPIGTTDARAISPPGDPMQSSEWGDARSVYAFNNLTGVGYRVPIDGGAPTHVNDGGEPIPCGPDATLIRSQQLDDVIHLRLAVQGKPERVLVELRAPETIIGTLHCSRDGKHVIYAVAVDDNPLSPQSDLWDAPTDGGKPRQLTHDKLRNVNPSFTPDGSIVFSSARGGTVNLWELPKGGGAPIQLTFGAGDDLEPVVTPDGKQLVFALDSTTSVIRSYGEGSSRISNARDFYSSLSVTPDGHELLVITPASDAITAIALADGARRTIALPKHGKPPKLATITADGASIVYLVGRELYAIPPAGGTAKLLATLDGDLRIMRAGPDHAIHGALEAPNRQEAWRIPLDGGPPRREGGATIGLVLPAATGWRLEIEADLPLHPHPAHLIPPDAGAIRELSVVGTPDWSLDGNVLGYFDGTKVHRLDVRDGSDHVIATPSDTQPSIAVSPHGATIYVSALEGFVRRYVVTNFADRR